MNGTTRFRVAVSLGGFLILLLLAAHFERRSRWDEERMELLESLRELRLATNALRTGYVQAPAASNVTSVSCSVDPRKVLSDIISLPVFESPGDTVYELHGLLYRLGLLGVAAK